VRGRGADDCVHQFQVDAKLEARHEQQQYGVAKVDAVGRRWYTQRFKNEVVAQCLSAGASVSKISIEYGLNTNLVRKWIGRARSEAVDVTLMPVVVGEPRVAADTHESSAAIEIRVGKSVIVIGANAPAQQIEAIVRALR